MHACTAAPLLAGEQGAGVAQGVDEVQRLELAAQPADEDVDCAAVDVLGGVAAQPRQDVIAAEDAAGRAGQQRQQLEFGAGQFHGTAVRPDAAARRVDREALEAQKSEVEKQAEAMKSESERERRGTAYAAAEAQTSETSKPGGSDVSV
jgi:hypothetical protein